MRATTKRAGAATAVTVMALTAFATPATGAAGEPEPRPAWVTVGTAPPGSTLETVQGTKGRDGSCAFAFALSLAPGEKAVRGDQVRVDPARCVTEVAVTRDAAASAATPAAPGASVETKRARPTSRGTATRESRDEVRAYTRSRGHLRTSWRDASGREAHAVRNDVDWNWNAQNCVTPNWGGYGYNWSTADGWKLRKDDWRNVYDCSRQSSSSAVHYGNDGVFCPDQATDAHYDRSTVHGTWDGRLEGEWKSWIAGGCADRLAFHHELRRSL
ncbi:hypothetical protein SUDANB58_02335 [Streptomyces sp. enrichment culture]|uniref:hypothetical protein n=1 Tax=Streptomyces sp. enrichment culture TaxID=1795815 RepID=UPI003F54A762